MADIELFFRFGGCALSLLIMALLLRDARAVKPARFGAALAFAVAALFIIGAGAGYEPPQAVRPYLQLIIMQTTILLWWFGLSLFDDEFRLGPIVWAVALIFFAAGLFNFSAVVGKQPLASNWAAWIRSAFVLFVSAHLIYKALTGLKTDLLERRRQARAWFALTIALLSLLNIIGEFAFGYYNAPLWFGVILHGSYFAVVVWALLWLGRFDPSELTFEAKTTPSEPQGAALNAKEQVLHEKLARVMEEERAYLESDLAIGALAERVNAPEHQVRALINKAMGYRNFRAFLNHYRLAAATAALRDPQKASLPILTIAMDSGFASLASFNRAFKAAEGATPSAYRAKALQQT